MTDLFLLAVSVIFKQIFHRNFFVGGRDGSVVVVAHLEDDLVPEGAGLSALVEDVTERMAPLAVALHDFEVLVDDHREGDIGELDRFALESVK